MNNTHYQNYTNSMSDNMTHLLIVGLNMVFVWFQVLFTSVFTLDNVNLFAALLSIFFLILRNARFTIAAFFDIWLFFQLKDKRKKVKEWLKEWKAEQREKTKNKKQNGSSQE